MVYRRLNIGRWVCDFFFAPDGYDIRRILSRMADAGAPERIIRDAYRKMRQGYPNEGFTWSNSGRVHSVVVIGPATDGQEFLDTIIHELGHLADHVALAFGMDPTSEDSKYILGDSARELADIICSLSCGDCK